MIIKKALDALSCGEDLSASQMEAVMEEIMTGRIKKEDIISFLTALNRQGETAEELTAAVKVMRRYLNPVKSKHKLILDTCGTGGDKKHTFNISTAVAFVVSGLGIAVAKHGNRSVSSKCGSADVLEAAGININMTKEEAEKCLDDIGIVFLFAQKFHPAMKYVMPARKEMKTKTIFNFLGPLSNPAGATHQLVGVYDLRWAKILASALLALGTKHALVVCGQDNMDEISTITKTSVLEVHQKNIKEYEIDPCSFGFKEVKLDDLGGGNAQENAQILFDLLNGKPGALRDIVVLNAGAAIYAADKVSSIEDGIARARESIDSKKALEKFQLLKEYSNR